MKLEIAIGGAASTAVAFEHQTNMSMLNISMDSMISRFKTVIGDMYAIPGGEQNIEDAICELTVRGGEEELNRQAAERIRNKTNGFIELAYQVDCAVATMVDNNKEEFYRLYPFLKPPKPKNFLDNTLDAVCSIFSYGKDLVCDCINHVWTSVKNFYLEHKKFFDTLGTIIFSAMSIMAVIGTGGLVAPGIIGLSVATIGASTTLNLANIWCDWLKEDQGFQNIRTAFNILSTIATGGTTLLGTKGQALMPFLLKRGMNVETAKNMSLGFAWITGGSLIGSSALNIVDQYFGITEHNEFLAGLKDFLSVSSFATSMVYDAGIFYNSIKKIDLRATIQEEHIMYKPKAVSSLKNTTNFKDESAIKHIFNGSETNHNGYHYDSVVNSYGKIVPGTEEIINDYGAFSAIVEFDGVPKVGNGGYSTFFPHNFSPQEVVNMINEAYDARSLVADTYNTYTGFAKNGMQITMYLDRAGKIISSFPTMP